MAYITDMSHYLDEDDCIGEMPGPAMDFALYLGSIVGWMTRIPVSGAEMTNVRCHRIGERGQCVGDIIGSIDRTTETIDWECPVCGERGSISGWHDTIFDRTNC